MHFGPSKSVQCFPLSLLIPRILTLASIVSHSYSPLGFLVLQCTLFVGTSCFYASMRPYKLNISSNVDCLSFAEAIVAPVACCNISPCRKKFTYLLLGPVLLLGVPHMILIFYICYVLAKKTGILNV